MVRVAVKFCSIASGSSGNSIFAGTEHTRILIDAGLSGKCIQDELKQMKEDGQNIDALFITHEHTDHIKGAGVISRRFDIPIYATQGTWDAMEDKIGKVSHKNKCYVYEGETCVINDMCIRPFAIPHDAAEPVGYNIFAGKHKITIATDLGHVTDKMKEHLLDSSILLLESNYDVDMLERGPYPRALKQRISGNHGHISNVTAGEVLKDVVSGKMKHVFLGHLSQDNNIPYLAFETVERILNQYHIKVGQYFSMDMATRYSRSRMVELS